MEPRVSMTAGIALISRTAKKHRESAKRVVTVAGMDRTAIIPVLLGHTAERATKSVVIVQTAPPVTQRRGRVLMGVTQGICRTAATYNALDLHTEKVASNAVETVRMVPHVIT